MIDPNKAWELVRRNGGRAMQTYMVWHSLVENAPYTFIKVLEDHFIIKRFGGGDNQKLPKTKVMKAVKKIATVNGIIKRRTLISPTVAEETAFVLFHPQLGWDENEDYIAIQRFKTYTS